MRYAIADTDKAVFKGIDVKIHRTNNVGNKMVVNENELLRINSDASLAASQLGGELLEHEQLKVELNKWNI